MEASAVHELLEELHPSLSRSSRICVVGGGPSGVSAAYALWKLGYEQVTLIEKHHTVGGMCESVDIQGRPYDLGGQVIARESAPNIKHLAQVARVGMEDMAAHKLSLVDSKTGTYQDLGIARDYISMIQITLDLQAQAASTGKTGVHALSSLAPETAAEFAAKHGMGRIPEAVATGYTASGYGFPHEQDIPYAYLHEFVRTSMFGKVCRIKGGYTGLWQGVARLLPRVRLNTRVTEIRRRGSGRGVTVCTSSSDGGEESEELEFDKIVISGAIPFAPPGAELMTLGDEEASLFSRVRTMDYYTTVLEISGFENKFPAGFYYFKDNVEDAKEIGHPVAMQKFYADTNIYLFWSYGTAQVSQEMMTALLLQDVARIGGTVERIVLQRKWNYFPHIGSQDMRSGLYDRLESLQGCNDTYYVGGLFAFELTERNAAYAMNLIAKNFGTPAKVKNLITGAAIKLDEAEGGDLEVTSEATGGEFPDLPCLDSYLHFYAKHSVARDKVLYTWLDDKGDESGSRTYAQLHNNANTIAHNLVTHKVTLHDGDRVLLLYNPGLEFIEAFFGCLRANVLPVPLIPPDVASRGSSSSSSHALAKVENVAAACGAKAILSTVAYHTAVRASAIRDTLLSRSGGRPSWPKLPWMHTDLWVSKQNKEAEDYFRGRGEAEESERCCFLQFTSGSTGDPKGVIITHAALIHNVKLMRRRYKSTSRTVLVSWLPQYHDMGLIGGLFTALVSGGTAILLSPTNFIRRPLLWLEAMSKYEATHSAAPNFAFDLVVNKMNQQPGITYQLSCLKFLMVSAEPVRSSTLKRFLKTMESSGLKEEVVAPGYGLAENCVFVSVAWGRGRPLVVDWQGKVCCGYVDRGNPDVDVRIVDPETGVEVGDGVEGEIWVGSPSNGAGYWGNERLSQDTFHARLEGGEEANRFLRTGDLGRVVKGMLFVTGRIKDLIIIRGRNVYPSDIEKTVEACSGSLRPGCCAAFGAPGRALHSKGIKVCDEDEVGVVVVAEVRDESKVDPEQLTAHISSMVASEHGLSVASVRLVKPRTISKTSSGKIRRLDCLKQFTEDRLDSISPTIEKTKKILRLRRSRTFSGTPGVIPPTPPPSAASVARSKAEVTSFLTEILAEKLGLSQAQVLSTKSFADYGLDSSSVVWAAHKLSSFLGVHVAAIDIYTAGCISELADSVESLVLTTKSSTSSQPVVPPAIPETDVSAKGPSKTEISNFICQIISERTGIDMSKLSPSQSFANYGLDSVAVVWASQKLSNFLGVHVAAIDIYTAGCISELCDVVDGLVGKTVVTQQQQGTEIDDKASLSSCRGGPYTDDDFEGEIVTDSQLESGILPSLQRQVCITFLQLLGIIYVAWTLLVPAAFILRQFTSLVADRPVVATVLCAPLCWLLYMAATALAASLGTSFLLPVLHLRTTVPLWSLNFVRWWTCYRLQDFASARIVANQLRGTVFVNWWYRLLGAQIGSGVELETTDITDPWLVVLGDGAAIGEGATLQCHEVKAGAVQFKPIRIGRRCSIGPYSFIGLGASLRATSVSPLGKVDGTSQLGVRHLEDDSSKVHPSRRQDKNSTMLYTLCQAAGLYVVSLVSAISGVVGYVVFVWLVDKLGILPAGARESQTGYIVSSLLSTFPWAVTAAIPLSVFQDPSSIVDYLIYVALQGKLLALVLCMGCAYIGYDLLDLGSGSHLGDFAKVITSDNGCYAKLDVGTGCVVGAQSVLMPGSCMEESSWLGALSVATSGFTLKQGGVYLGVENPTMVYNHASVAHEQDSRIVAMDAEYRKTVANLSAHIGKTSHSVKSRYFHRAGICGKGRLTVLEDLDSSFPRHDVFSKGKSYSVVVRHSNSLSSDDDARPDARGASLRILRHDHSSVHESLVDLTLKTGQAFYARNIADFVTWLTTSSKRREEIVKDSPHRGDAVWDSLRLGNSYAELHYYSNVSRLFKSASSPKREWYVRFRMRPLDPQYGVDEGRIAREGVLPPDTGALPRRDKDERSPSYLRDDFARRLASPQGVDYVLQLQLRPVPDSLAERDLAIDCTRAWDEQAFPYVDVAAIHLDELVDPALTEAMRFNPRNGVPSLDMIPATSLRESASIDHGRSVAYDIAQYVRNGAELPGAWKALLRDSDVPLANDISNDGNIGCPALSGCLPPNLAVLPETNCKTATATAKTRLKFGLIRSMQPLLQLLAPATLLGLSQLAALLPAALIASRAPRSDWLFLALVLLSYMVSALVLSLGSISARRILVGGRKGVQEKSRSELWGLRSLQDTVWQCVNSVACGYFLDLTKGSALSTGYLRQLGASIDTVGVYMDTLYALNPDRLSVKTGSSIGRDALLFGHVYEGGGDVHFGSNSVGEYAFVGARSLLLPGSSLEDGAELRPLGLAMKNELVKAF
ncbi:hypothetical protein SELMODRAFT_410953 [Selaginella moellendorffii]|uniref:Carrier domain-containing protein n=1 Tax=Selaginella moellendorffii TaxID=88036 RepID=D8RHJ0_SELML|nr:hypothetical protein SELMODRAFT_410953 [Selaginella moellendorffii]